ncbi:2-dehydro-3-deoxygalactonokinase [Frateuria aurantia]
MDSVLPAPRWIGLYAGPRHLSAFRYAPDGEVLDRRSVPWPPTQAGAELAGAITGLCSDWLDPPTHIGLLGAGLDRWLPRGMAPPPLEVPFDLALPATWRTPVRLGGLPPLYLLPEIDQQGIPPGRISGQGVALFGIRASSSATDLLIGLLGEQHQWVRLDGSRVRRFFSFATPSLQRLLSPGPADQDDQDWHTGAFDFGLAVARGEDRQAGLLASLATPQALVDSGHLQATELGSFRHGLLIGHELLGLDRVEPDAAPGCPVILVGAESSCLRYARALQLFGYEHVERARHAIERGLWQLASGLTQHPPVHEA